MGVRSIAAVGLAAVLGCAGCDRAASGTRVVAIRGMPTCPKNEVYARPLVVRIDRDRSLFDEELSVHRRVDAPQSAAIELSVPRERMRATLRIGVCAPTSLATWDCAAASWLASTTLTLDARSTAASVALPKVEAPCAPVAPR